MSASNRGLVATYAKDNAKQVASLLNMARKWSLKIINFDCKYDAKVEAYKYRVSLASKNSGTRGGRWKHLRCRYLYNLLPAQRSVLAEIGLHCCAVQDRQSFLNAVNSGEMQ